MNGRDNEQMSPMGDIPPRDPTEPQPSAEPTPRPRTRRQRPPMELVIEYAPERTPEGDARLRDCIRILLGKRPLRCKK